MTLIRAYFLMLVIGIVHAQVLTPVRPIGYWTSLLIAFLVTLGTLHFKLETK